MNHDLPWNVHFRHVTAGFFDDETSEFGKKCRVSRFFCSQNILEQHVTGHVLERRLAKIDHDFPIFFVSVDVMGGEKWTRFRDDVHGAGFQVNGVNVRWHILVPNQGVDRMHAGSDHLPQTDAHRVEEEDRVVLGDGKRMNIGHAPWNEGGDQLSVFKRRVTVDLERRRHLPIVGDAEIDGVIRPGLDQRMSARSHRFALGKHELAVGQAVEIELAAGWKEKCGGG